MKEWKKDKKERAWKRRKKNERKRNERFQDLASPTVRQLACLLRDRVDPFLSLSYFSFYISLFFFQFPRVLAWWRKFRPNSLKFCSVSVTEKAQRINHALENKRKTKMKIEIEREGRRKIDIYLINKGEVIHQETKEWWMRKRENSERFEGGEEIEVPTKRRTRWQGIARSRTRVSSCSFTGGKYRRKGGRKGSGTIGRSRWDELG